MTASTSVARAWITHPMGRAVRIAIAASGMVTATLVLMLAAVVEAGSWVMVFLGIGLAATSVASGRSPTATRLVATALFLVAVPLAIRFA